MCDPPFVSENGLVAKSGTATNESLFTYAIIKQNEKSGVCGGVSVFVAQTAAVNKSKLILYAKNI